MATTKINKQTKEDRRLANISLGFLILYISIMIIMSLIPGTDLQNTIVPTYSGILHFIEFMGLVFVASFTFILFETKYLFTHLTILVIFMSSLTEGIQHFIPGRVSSSEDFLINLAGGFTLISILILIVVIFYVYRRPSK